MTADSRKLMSKRYKVSPKNRDKTWGTTAYTTRCNQDAPIEVTASTAFHSMDSTSSASSFPKNPTVETTSVIMPANGPKPNIATNKTATISSWNARETARILRQTR